MNEEKPVLNIKGEFRNLNQIKELLPQIATLQEKYDVVLELHVVDGVKTVMSHFG
jgi:hypothetical protein